MEYEKIEKAADFVRSKINIPPTIGIILGSGLGSIADKIENKTEIPYSEIPYLCPATVRGHKGRFIYGVLNGARVICMQGRLHYYEGYDMSDITLPVRVMKLIGVQTLIVTNAAGGINTSFAVGDIMLIEDHINFMGCNPLIGTNIEQMGPRYCDMTHAYTPKLISIAKETAEELSMELKQGVYIACSGPSFETPAEICAFRTMGADAVGMSTVPEVIVASHCGMQVLGFSLITNMAAGVLDQPLSGGEVIEIGEKKSELMQMLICEMIKNL